MHCDAQVEKISAELVATHMSCEVLHKDLANEIYPDIAISASEAIVEFCVPMNAPIYRAGTPCISVQSSNLPSSLSLLKPAVRRSQEVPFGQPRGLALHCIKYLRFRRTARFTPRL